LFAVSDRSVTIEAASKHKQVNAAAVSCFASHVCFIESLNCQFIHFIHLHLTNLKCWCLTVDTTLLKAVAVRIESMRRVFVDLGIA
jgi:hypothetical protein